MGFVNQVTRFEYQQYNLRYEKTPNKQDFIPVNYTKPVYLQTEKEENDNRKEQKRSRREQSHDLGKKRDAYNEKKEQLIAELSGKGQYFREYA